MSNLKTVITFAIPVVTALFGLIWYLGKKKPPARKKLKLDDENNTKKANQLTTSAEEQKNDNNSADSVNALSNIQEQTVFQSKLKSSQQPEKNKIPDPVVVEQITPVIETKLKGQTVSETFMKPVKDEPVQNSMNDSLLSQIIVSGANVGSSNDQIGQEDVTCSRNEMSACERIVPDQNDSLNISPEIVSKDLPKNIQTVEFSSVIETNSEKVTQEAQKPTDVVLEENIIEISDGEPSSQMSKSWHEDVEESEKNSNGFPEERETNMSNEDKQPPAVVKNHKKDSCSPIKHVNDMHSLAKERSSMSPQSKNSSPVSKNIKQIKDEGLNHSESSSSCDNSSEASNDSGKGGSLGDSLVSHPEEDRVFEFNIPSDMCGLFIGTRGKTVKQIRDQSGARIRLKNNPYTRDFQICVVEGTELTINRACKIIKRKFPSISIPGIDSGAVSSTVIMPEIMQLNLAENVSIDVVVSSIVDAGRVFIQQPTHPSFPSLERLNSFMNQCYHHDGAVPDIPKPIESGVICAAPMLNGWYRAQIMVYYEDTDECDIKYVDYGGYSRISSLCLKQIRSDFMTLPFEAIECYLANVTPLENESYFSPESSVVLEELTQGKMLQAQVVGKAEDGIPYIHVYMISGPNQTVLVNRELVNRGVARWLELLS